MKFYYRVHIIVTFNEHVREKTNNLGFRPGQTQTALYSHRSKLEDGILDLERRGIVLSV